MVTSAMECQWYCRASRAAYSASPWVVSGLGLKQITLTPGTGGPQGPLGPPGPWSYPVEITSTRARCW